VITWPAVSLVERIGLPGTTERVEVRANLRARFLEGKDDRVFEAEYTALVDRSVPSIGSVACAGRREEARVQPLFDGFLWVTVAMGGCGANETRGAMVVAVDGGDRGEALEAFGRDRAVDQLAAKFELLAERVSCSLRIADE
jgi:hypothetical protein